MVKIGVANEMCVIAGGRWSGAGVAGVCALNLNNNRTNSNNNVGVRCDCAPSSNSFARQWSTGIGYPGPWAEMCDPGHSGSHGERLAGAIQ
jgi:hypothetical protein